ncbi:MAG: OmpA family protein [Flavobacteriales bacterium]|nr:OmpA family protein [Flavobacteriales bacterium]
MKKIILIFLSFIVLNANAQDCFVQKKSSQKKIDKLYTKLSKYSFSEVKQILQKIENKEGETSQVFDVYAMIYHLKKDVIQSQKYAKLCHTSCPDSFAVSNYILGELSYKRKDYFKALIYLKKSLEIGLLPRFSHNAKSLIESSKIYSELLKDTVSYNPVLVKGISTEEDEYLPLISPDQELAFFTRRFENKTHGILNKYSEVFVYSEGGLGSFNIGKEMPLPFNKNSNEGGATITIDNNVLYFTICSKFNSGYNNCDIYYVEKVDGFWKKIKPLSIVNLPKNWESQPTVSSDGNSLIFTSDRKGGLGGTDLYVVRKDKYGKWTEPKNLGPNVNSELNEKSPFLHVDGKTLFFASERFPSLGGYDIFTSKLNKKGFWKKPKNVGYPINTKNDELGMFVTTDGKTAYFCSNKLDGVGGWDLYSFDLYKEIRPERVLFLKGEIRDDNGELIDSVSMQFKNLTSNETQEILVENGKYVSVINLEENDDVLITFNKKDYAFNSQYISSENSDFTTPSELNVDFNRIEDGKSFKLNNIYFDTDSYDLNEVSKIILASFAEYLDKNYSLTLLISGHTDDVGEDKKNLLLSTQRSKAVYQFLIDHGVKYSRLSFKGFGENIPVDKNDTEEGRSRNRRTEFTIVDK